MKVEELSSAQVTKKDDFHLHRGQNKTIFSFSNKFFLLFLWCEILSNLLNLLGHPASHHPLTLHHAKHENMS